MSRKLLPFSSAAGELCMQDRMFLRRSLMGRVAGLPTSTRGQSFVWSASVSCWSRLFAGVSPAKLEFSSRVVCTRSGVKCVPSSVPPYVTLCSQREASCLASSTSFSGVITLLLTSHSRLRIFSGFGNETLLYFAAVLNMSSAFSTLPFAASHGIDSGNILEMMSTEWFRVEYF